MTRLLALLIAVLLPLQLAWGMAAGYCQHEPVAAGAGHFGHHSHVHGDAQPGGQAGDHTHSAQKAGKPGLQADLDCTGCHASTPAAASVACCLPADGVPGGRLLAGADLQLPSAPQRAPDRPQWPRLA